MPSLADLVNSFILGLLNAALDWILAGIGVQVLARMRDAVEPAKTSASLEDEVAKLNELGAENLSREGRALGAGVLSSVRFVPS